MNAVLQIWNSYTWPEKKNIAIYIGGIMFYKFGIEFFNGSIITLATDRFASRYTFTKLGAAQGVNQAAQCVGAILIAPLIMRWPMKTVLSGSILFFGLMTIILLIVDAGTKGKIKPGSSSEETYGSWNPDVIFPIWTLTGIAYGMVELVRRIIPVDIVGQHVNKLRRLDATVHIFYEVAGTGAAFASSSAISRFGNNYSFFLTPVFFAFAGLAWAFIDHSQQAEGAVAPEGDVPLADVEGQARPSYFLQVWHGIIHFGESVWLGTQLVLGHRRFIWLLPGYALALYLHRFLENSIAPAYAKLVLGTSAWSGILVGGSNFGELLGAFSVFVLSDYVTTPLPWLRVDALMLNLVWVLPHLTTMAKKNVGWAWRLAAVFVPISYGWAAGDVSLTAYIQAVISQRTFGRTGVSALGAVMAFLYSSYIVINAILSAVLGKVIDRDFSNHGTIYHALKHVGGIQFSVCSGIILVASFIPSGAFKWNPNVISDIGLKGEPDRASDTNESVVLREL